MKITKYPKKIRILHWLTAMLILCQIIIWFLLEDFETLFYAHMIFGFAILSITTIRIIIKYKHHDYPPCPEKFSTKEWALANTGHHVLYLFLIITPITGLLAAVKENNFIKAHDINEIITRRR